MAVLVMSALLSLAVCAESLAAGREERPKFVPAFKETDIEQITIMDGMGKRKLATIAKEYWSDIYEDLGASRHLAKGERPECLHTRRTVIRLRDGREYALTYHAQCGAREVVLRQLPESKVEHLDNLALKKRLLALEVTHLRLRFVRTIWKGQHEVEAVTTAVDNAYLGMTSEGLDDRRGQYYKMTVERGPDAAIRLSLTVTNYKQRNGHWVDEGKKERSKSFVFRPGDLNLKGMARVVDSTPDELLVMTCEPKLTDD